MPQLLSSHASTREPVCCKLQSPSTLEPTHHNQREKNTHTSQLERSPRAATKDPACRNETSCVLQLRPWRRASLVVQWLRIRLPMQGTRVRALVREDPTCRGATKPVRHSYWACALEPASHNYWARVLQLLKPARLEPVLRNKRNHCNEKPAHHNEE